MNVEDRKNLVGLPYPISSFYVGLAKELGPFNDFTTIQGESFCVKGTWLYFTWYVFGVIIIFIEVAFVVSLYHSTVVSEVFMMSFEDINFYQIENAVAHHTNQYQLVLKKPGTPVLRRGQTFKMAFTTHGIQYQPERDTIRLIFSFGKNPTPFQNTQGMATLGKEWVEKQTEVWAGRLISQISDHCIVEVMSSVMAPVGLWKVRVEGTMDGKPCELEHTTGFYLLFNPWCKDDSVYMPDEHLLDEYILSDSGKIWKGSYNSCQGRPWVFGQFHKAVLPACMLIMERTGLHPLQRGNPVKVARVISKLVNSNDDEGVIQGKWREPYIGGLPPTAWTGSVQILQQYLETGREVRYGQCWVFAGVLTTVCRALGLPSRVVSNLESAHDSNASLSIDRYYDQDLSSITRGVPNDSIWNFHVWNDVWMARMDLPAGYGGWQAVDSTPQETSDGFFQCGPASVRAIRSGNISLPFDSPFIYASVNADIIRWKEDPDSDLGFIKIQTIKDYVGKMILTKKPFVFDHNGEQDREEITDQYKHKEGSDMERMVIMNAAQTSERTKRYYEISEKKADVNFKLLPLEKILIGESYRITVQVENTSEEPRTIKAVLSSTSIFYTGIVAHEVKKIGTQFILDPQTREEIATTVTSDDYLPKLVEYGIMKINVIASVGDTNQTWADEDDFQVIKPTVNIEVKGHLKVGKKCEIELAFMNPMNEELKKCTFFYESSGAIKPGKVKVKDVRPGKTVKAKIEFSPKKAGKFQLVVLFVSRQLMDVHGSTELDVAGEE